MNITLVGYGKMGHIIEEAALSLGHTVVSKIDIVAKDATLVQAGDYASVARLVKESHCDGVIEFTHPTSVLGNIKAILPLGIPLVVGTTGWHDHEDEIANLAHETGGTIMTSSNFSIGVNMFYKIVAEATRLLSQFPEYDVAINEIHHNQKADSPSGTAKELASIVMQNTKSKTAIETGEFHQRPAPAQLHVSSTRVGSTPGTHTVYFDSEADTIELVHRARSRKGFAMGAVRSLQTLNELLNNGTLKKGALYHMGDLF